MKVFVAHNFYQQFGGEDAVALAEKQLLESHAEEVVFYSRHNDDIKQYSLIEKIHFGFQTIFSRQTKEELHDLVRQFHPDVAYVHNVFPLISPALYHVLHALRIPIVQVIHDFRFLCPNGWFYTQGKICERCKSGNYWNAIRYRCYRDSYPLSALYSASLGVNRFAGVLEKIDAFVCLTEFSKKKLLEVNVPERKIFIKPNFLDVTATAPQPGVGNYVVYLGRLSAEKGIWTLVRAFERLREVPLKIVGTGPLEAQLKSYVQERNLSNISFMGFKQGQEKSDLLSNSFCTIVSSEWYENFPVVVLEAYAAAKPVIGSCIGSLPYIIEEGKSGLLFEPGNPIDLAEKVKTLLDCPQLRAEMGRYGRALVESKYSPQQSYETLKTIFTQVQSQL